MILPAQILRDRKPLSPFIERSEFHGTTYGCGPAGYDVRIAEELDLGPGVFVLASTIERFEMPNDLLAVVHDKSTWARRGLAVQNTVIEPGWTGYLTLELSVHGTRRLHIPKGCGIVQVIFHQLLYPTDRPYQGKYMDQEAGPQEAR